MRTPRPKNIDVPDVDDPDPDDLPDVEEFPPFDENDMEDGESPARMCYAFNFLLLPFSVVPLWRRDNPYALYHAKQALGVWCCLIIVLGLGKFFIDSFLGPLIWMAGVPVFFGINVAGMIQVGRQEAKGLPLLGTRAQSWFQSIRFDPDREEF